MKMTRVGQWIKASLTVTLSSVTFHYMQGVFKNKESMLQSSPRPKEFETVACNQIFACCRHVPELIVHNHKFWIDVKIFGRRILVFIEPDSAFQCLLLDSCNQGVRAHKPIEAILFEQPQVQQFVQSRTTHAHPTNHRHRRRCLACELHVYWRIVWYYVCTRNPG